MSQLGRLVRVARADFSYFFRTKWLMAILLTLSLSDMLVTALVYGKIVSGLDYFRYLVPGIIVVGLFSAATDTGRRVWLALRDGMVQYYMTLPLNTSGLVVANIISGGLGGLVYSGLLLLIASIVITPQGAINAILILPFLFVLSTGIAGLAAFFASVSRRGEIYWVYAQPLQVSMVTISTVFYPAQTIAQYLPAPVATIAQYNPLRLAAGVLRNSAFGGNALETGALPNLHATSLPLAVIGALAYWIILRTIRLKGKP